MICNNCRKGADEISLIESLDINQSPFKLDTTIKIRDAYLGKGKTLHAMCESNDCFCQHRVGSNVRAK